MTVADNLSSVIYGCAKLGLDNYGSCPTSKLVGNDDKLALLSELADIGIHRLDAASDYGNVHELIGLFHRRRDFRFAVDTKVVLKSFSDNCSDFLRREIDGFLVQMDIEQIEVLYLHQNSLEVISNPFVQAGLLEMKTQKKVKKIGVSVYSTEESLYALDSGVYDVIQMPVNICNTLIYQQYELQSRTIECIARSIFLQGLIFFQEEIPNLIRDSANARKYFTRLRKICQENSISIESLAIRFLSTLPRLNGVILSSLSVPRIQKQKYLLDHPLSDDLFGRILTMSSKDRSWTNPRNWSL